MSYCIQCNPIVSVQQTMNRRVQIEDTEARANSAGLRQRGRARAEDAEPSLITAIARELAKVEGGRIVGHLTGARHLLEDAFCAVEQVKNSRALCGPSPHAA